METPVLLAVVAVVALTLLAAVVAAALRRRTTSRRDLAAALADARSETAELRHRLDVLSEQLEHQSTAMIRVDDPAFVITDAGAPQPRSTVPDRVVLTATMGEPLVKAVAFGHGLRRALSAESRNRIWFEMRREVRRARKQRRRETKDAWRRKQAEDRAEQAGRMPATTRPHGPVARGADGSPRPADAA